MTHLEKSDDGSLLMDYSHMGLSQKILKNFNNFSTMPTHFVYFTLFFLLMKPHIICKRTVHDSIRNKSLAPGHIVLRYEHEIMHCTH